MDFSDDDYFPLRSDVVEWLNDEAEDEDREDEDRDEEEEDDNDRNPLSRPAGSYENVPVPEEDEEDAEGEEEEAEYEEAGVASLERILLQSHPGFLRQIQQILAHGFRDRDDGGEVSGRRRHARRRRIQDLPPLPYQAGKHLLTSGEFGEIDDPRCRKRRYEGAKTVTQFARFRELGRKRGSTLGITKRWLPGTEQGKIVAQYDRHVYSGQFSHDGTFFYTASQDFKCRMYQTLNPGSPSDWKLYKVHRIFEEDADL